MTDFFKYRYISFALALLAILATAFSLATQGIRYGIDFKGGYVIEARLNEEPDIARLREQIQQLKIGSVSIQKIGQQEILLRGEATDSDNIQKIKGLLGQVEYRKIENIGPKVGAELTQKAFKGIFFALIAMLIYITIRFQWSYAISAIIGQMHDCFVILALFTIFGYEFNETAIIGILTTAGYSINDKIVIFDRIRENMAKCKDLSLPEIINLSTKETLSRTLLTILTTMLALFAMYFFGGKVIAEFSLPIIVGILMGTFSSIFVAAPLLPWLGLKKEHGA